MTECKICGSASEHFARARILHKYDIEYLRCPRCGFVQTEAPYWLAEAYASALVPADVGVVERNLRLGDVTQAVVGTLFPRARRFLDFGAGYGLFVRLMRDRGFDFRWSDEHAPNLFGRGFEASLDERYDLATAFEVFEHLVDPVPTVRALAERADALLFSTELLPPGPPKPNEWWYYALFGGQHVSLYTERAVHVLAERAGMHAVTNGATLHLLSHAPTDARRFRLVSRPRVARLLGRATRRASLLQQDFELLSTGG